MHQLTEQVVARLGPAPLHLGDEEVHQAVGAAGPTLGDVGELEQVAHPPGERVGQRGRHPEDAGDDPDGDLLGVVMGGVGAAEFHEPVDELGTQGAGHPLVPRHPPMGEPGQQEAPGPGVQGRVGRDGRQAVGQDGLGAALPREGDDRDLGRAEVVDVVRQVDHVLVPGREPRRAPPVGVGHRARPTQLVPDGEGVGHVAGAEHVEVGVPTRHRHCLSHGAPRVVRCDDTTVTRPILPRQRSPPRVAASGATVRWSGPRRPRGPTRSCTRIRPRPGRPPRPPPRPGWRSPAAT